MMCWYLDSNDYLNTPPISPPSYLPMYVGFKEDLSLNNARIVNIPDNPATVAVVDGVSDTIAWFE